jgi:hypothetical protein
MPTFYIENERGEPVPSAHIVRADGLGLISNAQGTATVGSADMVGTWTISHVSYQTKTVPVTMPIDIGVELFDRTFDPVIITPDAPGGTTPPASPPPAPAASPQAPANNNFLYLLALAGIAVYLTRR